MQKHRKNKKCAISSPLRGNRKGCTKASCTGIFAFLHEVLRAAVGNARLRRHALQCQQLRHRDEHIALLL